MEFNEILTSRRAVNYFDTEKDVPDSLLREIIEMASKAPSSFNLQPWSLIILRDKGDKTRLRKLAMDQPKVTEAPVILMVLADRTGWKGGHEFVEKNFSEMVKAGSMSKDQHDWFLGACGNLYGDSEEKEQAFACKNAGFFAMTLMYAAKNVGLDSHPMDGFDHEGVRKEFKIPDQYWIPLLLAIGYFDSKRELGPPKWRKTFEEIVVEFP